MTAATPDAATHLDLRGLKCPLPALRLRKALLAAGADTVLLVACTDPMAAIDIPHLLRETGDVLEEARQDAGLLTFRVRRQAGPAPQERTPEDRMPGDQTWP